MTCASLCSSEKVFKCREWVDRLVSEGTQTLLAQRKSTHWIRLILLKVNIIIWISEDQELQRNPMKSSDSRTNSKYKSPYGCRTNSHCVQRLSSSCVYYAGM